MCHPLSGETFEGRHPTIEMSGEVASPAVAGADEERPAVLEAGAGSASSGAAAAVVVEDDPPVKKRRQTRKAPATPEPKPEAKPKGKAKAKAAAPVLSDPFDDGEGDATGTIVAAAKAAASDGEKRDRMKTRKFHDMFNQLPSAIQEEWNRVLGISDAHVFVVCVCLCFERFLGGEVGGVGSLRANIVDMA